MILKVLLIVSIVLQLIAAIVAIGLTRVTKYNLSWMLFTVALTCMAFMRFGEYIQITRMQNLRLPDEFFVWMGVATSLCCAVGMLLVQKIFKYIANTEAQRRMTEKRILNTIIHTEEKERLRFSKDLHDGLGPLLSSAKMSVSALSSGNYGVEEQQEIIRNTNHVIDEAIRSLREISTNLSPHVLNTFGLARALSNFINKLAHTDIKIAFTTNLREERFDADIEVILYRVICELVNNSIKHSGASRIRLLLKYSERGLHVEYSDNGCGFDTSRSDHPGMGISNVRSRISSLKGEFTIASTPRKGMEARIWISCLRIEENSV